MNNPEQSTQNEGKTSELEYSDNSQTQEDFEKQTRGKRKRKESKDELEQEDMPGKLTDSEKTDLFNALIQHGSADISLLQSYVPSKTEEQVRRFIFCYKRVARHTVSEGQTRAPIDKWLDFLTSDVNDREKLHDMCRVLKYIALFEPCSNESEAMLSDCYQLLSDCMKGESPKHLNPVTSMFLHGKMQQLIRIFKSQDFDREHKYLETYKKKLPCYVGKRKARNNGNKVDETQISNPLKIPDSLLELKK